MNEAVEFIQSLIANIDSLVDQQLKNGGLCLGQWKEDETLKLMITDFRNQAQIVSHSCVKFALLVTPTIDFQSNVITSILDEIKQQCQLLFNIFHRITDHNLSKALFDDISGKLKPLFVFLVDVLKYATDRDKDSINYTTGMITKVAEEIQKIPLANKAAYRRFFLQKILSIKETKDEFEQYLQKARDQLETDTDHPKDITQSDNDDKEEEEEEDDDDFYDDEEEEREYTREEIPIVEVCVNLFQHVMDCLKFSLKTFTDLADEIQSTGSIEQQKLSQEWIALIEKEIEVVDGQVTNLGALLYPPVETEDQDFLSNYQMMNETMLRFLSILSGSDTATSSHQELRIRLSSDTLCEIERYQSLFQVTHFPL